MADATAPNNVNPETWKQILLHESTACNKHIDMPVRESAMRKLATAYKGTDRNEAKLALMRLATNDNLRVSGYALGMLNKHFSCNHLGRQLKRSVTNGTGPELRGDGNRQVRCPSYSSFGVR